MSLERHIASVLAVASLILLVLCLHELAVVTVSTRWWVLLAAALASWPVSVFLRFRSYQNRKEPRTGNESPVVTRDSFSPNSRVFLAFVVISLFGATGWLYRAEFMMLGGATAFRNGDYERAIARFTSAIDSDLMPNPRLATIYGKRGSAWYEFAVSYALGDEALIQSLNDYSRSYDMNPRQLSVALGKASAFRALGAYEESVNVLNEAIKLDRPKPFESLIRRAQTYRAAENYDASLADLDRLLDIWGDLRSMKFHYHRGRLFLKMGRYSQAVESFTTGIPEQISYPWAYIYRACANARLGDLGWALRDYELGVKMINRHVIDYLEFPGTRHTVSRLTAELESLRLLANGAEVVEIPPDRMCEDDWNWGDKHRERSPLM